MLTKVFLQNGDTDDQQATNQCMIVDEMVVVFWD